MQQNSVLSDFYEVLAEVRAGGPTAMVSSSAGGAYVAHGSAAQILPPLNGQRQVHSRACQVLPPSPGSSFQWPIGKMVEPAFSQVGSASS